ncbi:MAG: septal ring lytic transglycosylase RlpA family protein [Myxococcales bacterium]|nr:septal ring lytic transglycosylase RlpA family protein [Myxococcales bacterium]
MRQFYWILGVCLISALSCGGKAPISKTPGSSATGKASWYGGKYHGRKTASGERFDKRALTAAHRTLPFGTKVRVTNLSNQKSVVVRITDRGPFGRRERIVDLSEAAAEMIGMKRAGVVRIRLEVLSGPS